MIQIKIRGETKKIIYRYNDDTYTYNKTVPTFRQQHVVCYISYTYNNFRYLNFY